MDRLVRWCIYLFVLLFFFSIGATYYKTVYLQDFEIIETEE